ncbi:helix-turn-helix domain-containing protein [Amycolatopsis thailandensis]|uniref:helix-turn-helix domain-containing protein n=1 Tax=Amycolatopsis thailandensis TaxID=589330 RepID=UPI00365F64AF
MVDQLLSRPALLRYWRVELAGLGLDAVARAAGVESPTTIHNWEAGHTDGPSLRQLAAVDERFDAGGTLRDVYLALRTPDALNSAEKWWCNFQGESGPCWAWLRVPGGQPGTAHVDAGPFRVDCEIPADTGVFLQAHAFASNPAVHVRIDGGGWVDFGYGIVPTGIGTLVVDAVDVAVVGPRAELEQAFAVASRSWLPHRYQGNPRWFTSLKKHLGRRVEVARSALSAAAKAAVSTKSDVSSSLASLEEVPRHWGGERYRQLRNARGLSLQDTAELASDLDPSLAPVTKDHIHRLEHGATPRVTQLVERLDTVLGADGRTCTAEVTGIQGTGRFTEITFPSYWVGPVWVQFLLTGQAEKNSATLLWSPWHKRLDLRHGVVVTTRRSEPSMPPLQVDLAAGWRVRAGVGVHPRAVDVNEGWGLISREVGFPVLAYYFSVVEQAMRAPRRDK